jgi:AcrR family transcriptional regulator
MMLSYLMKYKADPLLIQMFSGAIRKADLQKAKIIESAIDLLATAGLENFSFEKIGAKAKIRKSNVSYHFRSKEEILRRCFEYMAGTGQTTVVEHLSKAAPGSARLTAYIEGNLEWARLYPDQVALLTTFHSKASALKEYQELNADFRLASSTRLEALLQEPGLLTNQSSNDRKKVAGLLIDLVIGAFIDLATRPQFSTAAFREKTKSLVDGAHALVKGFKK